MNSSMSGGSSTSSNKSRSSSRQREQQHAPNVGGGGKRLLQAVRNSNGNKNNNNETDDNVSKRNHSRRPYMVTNFFGNRTRVGFRRTTKKKKGHGSTSASTSSSHSSAGAGSASAKSDTNSSNKDSVDYNIKEEEEEGEDELSNEELDATEYSVTDGSFLGSSVGKSVNTTPCDEEDDENINEGDDDNDNETNHYNNRVSPFLPAIPELQEVSSDALQQLETAYQAFLRFYEDEEDEENEQEERDEEGRQPQTQKEHSAIARVVTAGTETFLPQVLAAADGVCDAFVQVQHEVSTQSSQKSTALTTLWFFLENSMYDRISELYMGDEDMMTQTSRRSSSSSSRRSSTSRSKSRRHLLGGKASKDALIVNEDDHDNNGIPTQLTPRHAALLLCWISTSTQRWKAHGLRYASTWKRDEERLFQHYANKAVRKPLRATVAHSLQLQTILGKGDIRTVTGTNGLVTGLPADVAYMCQNQIRLAQQHLSVPAPRSDFYVERVLDVCNDELLRFTQDMTIAIATHWKVIRTARFVAILNDAVTLVEQCEERNEQYLSSADDALQERGQKLVQELMHLSCHSMQYLSHRMIHDDLASCWNCIGTRAWEEQASSSERSTTAITESTTTTTTEPAAAMGMEHVVLTLQDFFRDVEEWMMDVEFYFPKLLQGSFDAVLQTYLSHFCTNTATHGIANASHVAAALMRDYSILTRYFVADPVLSQYHGRAGFESPDALESALRLLRHVSCMVDPTNRPSDALDSVVAVLEHVVSGGDTGTAFILHIAGLRSMHPHTKNTNTSSSSNSYRTFKRQAVFWLTQGLQYPQQQEQQKNAEALEWVNVLATAKKRLEASRRESSMPVVVIPALTVAPGTNHDTTTNNNNTHKDASAADEMMITTSMRRRRQQQRQRRHRPVLQVSDMRSSPYLRQVRPNLSDVDRLSSQSKALTMSVRQLLSIPLTEE